MKKVLLTGAALMAFAAAGLAQNTTSYTGTGTGQTSTQNQTGNGLKSTVKQGSSYSMDQGNSSITDQKGKDNKATVTQDLGAKNNRAGIAQTDGSAAVGGGNGNTAEITQTTNSGGTATRPGTFGKDATAGEGNWAGILQGQQSNKSTISQSNGSSSNFGEIYQTGSNNGQGAVSSFAGGLPVTLPYTVTNLKTAIVQDNNSVGNAALIKQAGINGGAVVNQSNGSSQNEATVQQTGGDGNQAVVSQDGTGGSSALNMAKVTQSGNVGLANVIQGQNSQSNQATVIQNEANIVGYSTTTVEVQQVNNSYGNIATVSQTGFAEAAAVYQNNNSHDNTATINQTGTFANPASFAEIDQVTDVANAEATINQAGTGNQATVTQTYAYNTAGGTARGSASGGNTVLVNQNQTTPAGTNNIVNVLQGGNASNITAGSKVTIDQADSHNSAYLQQTGQTLTAKVSQDGNYNLLAKDAMSPTSNALQLGSNYTLSVTQSAPGATLGASNSAFVNSNNIGGGGITINQTLTNN